MKAIKIMVSKNGKLVGIYQSQIAAAIATGINYQLVITLGKSGGSCRGFTFKRCQEVADA